jgi:protein SCO1/2
VWRDVEALAVGPAHLPPALAGEIQRAVAAIGSADETAEANPACCDLPAGLGHLRRWDGRARRRSDPIESVSFQDQHGEMLTFAQFFRGAPAILVFFYTRCDNPLKCSLTITKLARVQALLRLRGADRRVRTAGITYDPAFDSPDRLRRYGENRGVHFSGDHRLLRMADGFERLRAHFGLGVNFTGAIINRHRLETYVLDREGRIAGSFLRLHWDESAVVDRAMELLDAPAGRQERCSGTKDANAIPLLGMAASTLVALLPKCPVCWTVYVSSLGIAGLERFVELSSVRFVLGLVLILNLVSVTIRAHAQRRLAPALTALAGAAALVGAQVVTPSDRLAAVGVILTAAGGIWSVSARGRPAFAPRSVQSERVPG